jgi:hypothetical protein
MHVQPELSKTELFIEILQSAIRIQIIQSLFYFSNKFRDHGMWGQGRKIGAEVISNSLKFFLCCILYIGRNVLTLGEIDTECNVTNLYNFRSRSAYF